MLCFTGIAAMQIHRADGDKATTRTALERGPGRQTVEDAVSAPVSKGVSINERHFDSSHAGLSTRHRQPSLQDLRASDDKLECAEALAAKTLSEIEGQTQKRSRELAWEGRDAFWKIKNVLDFEVTLGKSIADLKTGLNDVVDELRAADKRLQRLKVREEVVIMEASAAARDASTLTSNVLLRDTARRIGVLDERSLNPPAVPRRTRSPRLSDRD